MLFATLGVKSSMGLLFAGLTRFTGLAGLFDKFMAMTILDLEAGPIGAQQ